MPIRAAMAMVMLMAAVGLGLIAYQLTAPRPHPAAVALNLPPPPPPPKLVSYLVAARPLQPGTLARIEDFSLRTDLADKTPAGAIVNSPEARASLRGALIHTYVEAGAPISADDLTRPRDHGFLAAVLDPGTRAVSIAVDAVSGVAGLIWPGDRVDVILTQETQQATSAMPLITSETVLENVRVIAVDQDIAQGAPTDGGGLAGKLVSTVTIQATPVQAERLAVATHLGHLSLAMRSVANSPTGNGAAPAVSGADVSRVLSRPGSAPGTRVQVIQGDQRGEVTFR